MPRPAKAAVPSAPPAPTLDQVVAVGTEFEALKAEEARIEAALKRKGDFLRAALAGLPGQRIRIGDRDLGLVPQKSKEVFDLAAAEKRKSLAPLLQPYIDIVRTLDLKAARKHIHADQLADFITETPRDPQLKFLKPDGGDE